MSNVFPLFDSRLDRLSEIREWFTKQANAPAGHVAAVSIAITGDGMVKSSGRGIEPEHAVVILEELKDVVARLEAIAAEDAPPQRLARHQCQVIPMQSHFAASARA